MDDHTLFLIKGVIAFLGAIILLHHMIETEGDMSLARALRYVALFAAAAAVAYASQEQIRQGVEWESRQWGGLLVAVFVLLAAIASELEDRGITLTVYRKER